MPPKEFTPEITEAFFNRLAGNIRKRGERNRGLARSEALSRGLERDPFERSAVSVQREKTKRAVGDLEADIGFRVAGLQREERIGTERREDVQSFQSGEADKDRAFREKLARLGFDFERDASKTRSRRDLQSGLLTAGATGIFGGIGQFAGTKFGGG